MDTIQTHDGYDIEQPSALTNSKHRFRTELRFPYFRFKKRFKVGLKDFSSNVSVSLEKYCMFTFDQHVSEDSWL